MGLRQVFIANSRPRYDLGGTHNFTSPTNAFNAYLLTAPRLYGEELQCFTRSTSAGALMVSGIPGPDILQGPNHWSAQTIMYMAQTYQTMAPGYAMSYWLFDNDFGIDYLVVPPILPPTNELVHYHRVPVGADPLTMFDQIHVDPSGYTWAYGTAPDATYGGAVRFDTFALVVTAPVTVQHADYLDPRGNPTVGIVDFAIDQAANRVFVRWTSNNPGEVSVYRLSTKEFLFDLWMPNATSQIIAADQQFVFIFDIADWIGIYDFTNGLLLSMCRNPRPAFIYGRASYQAPVYGWDSFYKRLLCVRAFANSSDGSSNLQLVGFRPVADAVIISPPIPRNVPRAGRSITVVSHAFGDGGEPVAARPTAVSGGATLDLYSDHDGDIVIPVTCGLPGALTINVALNNEET